MDARELHRLEQAAFKGDDQALTLLAKRGPTTAAGVFRLARTETFGSPTPSESDALDLLQASVERVLLATPRLAGTLRTAMEAVEAERVSLAQGDCHYIFVRRLLALLRRTTNRDATAQGVKDWRLGLLVEVMWEPGELAVNIRTVIPQTDVTAATYLALEMTSLSGSSPPSGSILAFGPRRFDGRVHSAGSIFDEDPLGCLTGTASRAKRRANKRTGP